jgi:hypothetical protein
MTAAAGSEGGGVEVNDGGALRGRRSRRRWRQCDNDQELEEEDDSGTLRGQGRGGGMLQAGDEVAACSKLGSRTAGCGDGKVVSRAIEEAEVSGHHYT